MTRAVPLDELLAAAASVTTTFEQVPAEPVRVRDPSALTPTDVAGIGERYARHGFAVLRLVEGSADETSLLVLSRSLGLGTPFVPPLYRQGGEVPSVSRISAASNAGTGNADHPSFGRTVGQRLHCDGTLQDIGYVKASVLLCESPASEGGASTLFNSTGAFARLAGADPAAAAALATPGTLVRQANINGSREQNAGPAFTVHEGTLVGRYSVTDTDRWVVPAGVAEDDLRRGVEFLDAAARPGGREYHELELAAGEALVFDNTRISHGRSAYRDSEDRRRCLYRSLHLAHPYGSGRPASIRGAR